MNGAVRCDAIGFQPGTGRWLLAVERRMRDPPKGIEAVRQHVIEQGKLEIVEIRVEYLSEYLQARQMAVLVEHIRRLQLYNPTQEIIDRFEVPR
jgi:hypothetical protein